MNMPHLVRLSMRLMARDWRSGDLLILFLALMVAVASSTSIILFADRMNRTMEGRAAEFMGADLVVRGHEVLADTWQQQAEAGGLQYTRTTEFTSVIVNNDKMLLSSIKAVSPQYPLRGTLRISQHGLAEEFETSNIPTAGTAWVDQRVLTELGLALEDEITVGSKTLRITHVLTYEPDRRGDFYSLSPRVMINTADLAATGVVQPGSHVHYLSMFAGDEVAVLALKRQLEGQLQPGQRLSDVYEDRPELGNALARAEQYLGLASVVVVLISGVAIAMAARRYGARHYDLTALLRCFGARQNDVLVIYLVQIAVLGIVASACGTGLGWLGQAWLLAMLAELLPQALYSPGVAAVFFSMQSGLLILFGFSVLPVLRQRQVSPVRVLRRDFSPMPPSTRWLLFIGSLIMLLLVWHYTGNPRLTFTIFGGGLLLTGVLAGISLLLLRLVDWITPAIPLPWRLGLRSMTHHQGATMSQILAFAITLMALVIIILVRTDLLNDWRQKLPDNAPNYFALNIFEHEVKDVDATLKDAGAETSEIYPIVRGRLIQINGENVRTRVSKDSTGERAINRELSLTWSEKLPDSNQLVAGSWQGQQLDAGAQVSIEAKLADSLSVRVDDVLRFTVGSQELTARVGSIRTVEWDSMTPNFYMIFSPGVLDEFPKTYLTSFYLGDSQRQNLGKIASAFPAMTILDVDAILKQVRNLFEIVSAAVEFILVFALLAGLLVLLAAVYASYDERLFDTVMMRTLGASRRVIRTGLWIEFVGTGALSGLLAALVAEGFILLLYEFVLKMPFQPAVWIWLATPLAGAMIVGVSGFFYSRNLVETSPARMLRQTG